MHPKLIALTFISFALTSISFAAEAPPPDTCVLELTLPDGATTTIDGNDYGEKRKLSFGKLQPGKRYTCKLVVKYADGTETTRTLYIQGGWTIQCCPRPQQLGFEPVFQFGKTTNEITFDNRGLLMFFGSYWGGCLVEKDTGRLLRAFPGENKLAMDPNGQYLAAAMPDYSIELWEAATGKVFHRMHGHGGTISDMVFSPDGRQLLSVGHDRQAILWDTQSGDQLQVIHGTSLLTAVAISPDGSQILTGEYDKSVTLWDTATAKRVRSFSCKEGPDLVAFSADGKRILAKYNRYANDKSFRGWSVWDVVSSKPLLAGESEEVNCVCLSPDGKELLTGGGKQAKGDETIPGRITVYNATDGKQLRAFDAHQKPVVAMAFTPDGRELYSANYEDTIIWNWPEGKQLRKIDTPSLGWWGPVALSEDGDKLLTSGRPTTLRQLPSLEIIRALPKELSPTHLAMNAAGTRMVSADNDHTEKQSNITLWNLETGEKLQTMENVPFNVGSLSATADASRILAFFYEEPQNRTAILWDTATGKQVRTFSDSKNSFRDAAVSPDGKYVLTAAEKTVTLWNAADGQTVRSFDHNESIKNVAFSPDGRQFAIAEAYAKNNTILLFDTASGKRLQTFAGHKEYIISLAFGPDGQTLLSTAGDGTAIVWDVPAGTQLRKFNTLGKYVYQALMIGRAGRHVLTISSQSAQLWDIATGEEVATLYRISDSPDWYVLTPEGLFDGSPEVLKRVEFRIGDGPDVAPVPGLVKAMHRPGLLAELLAGGHPQPPALAELDKTPTIKVVSPPPPAAEVGESLTVEVELSDRGAGLSPPWLRHNADKVKNPEPAKTPGRYLFTVPLLPGVNRIEVHAATADGAWRSRPEVFTLERKHAAQTAAATTRGPELVIQTGHSDEIAFSILSPDAQLVLTGSKDRTAILWEAQSGQQIHTLHGHSGNLSCGAFRPDGRQVATGGYHGQVIIWDVETGRMVRSLGQKDYSVNRVAFTPDGAKLVVATDKHLTVWEPATGNLQRDIEITSGKIEDMAVSPDGRQVMTAIEDKETPRVVIWDITTGAEAMVFPGLKGKQITNVAFSPDGRRAIHAWNDNQMGAIVWDLAARRQVCAAKWDHEPKATAYSPDGTKVISGSYGLGGVVWDANTGAVLKTLHGWNTSVRRVAITPDASRLMMCGSGMAATDGELKRLLNELLAGKSADYISNFDVGIVVDAATGKWLHTFKEAGYIESAAFSPDGSRLLTAARDEITVRDTDSGRQITRFAGGEYFYSVSCASFSPDGRRIIGLGKYKTVSIWDADTGRQINSFEAPEAVKAVVFSPDGQHVLTGGGKHDTGPGEVILWNANSGREVRRYTGLQAAVETVAFSPDGQKILAAVSVYNKAAENRLLVWDVDSAQVLCTIELGRSGAKQAVFSADSRRILVLDEFADKGDKSITVWDAETGKLVRRLRAGCNGIDSMALAADGRYLFTGAYERAILWDLEQGVALRTFQGHDYAPKSVGFTPDGRRALTGGEKLDEMAFFWDVETGLQINALRGRVGPVRAAAFSPDGRRLATAGDYFGYNAILWDLATGQQLRVLGSLGEKAEKLVFSPDGRQVAAKIYYRDVAVQWDAATGRELYSYKMETGEIKTIAFTPDGKYLVGAGGHYKEGGRIVFWDAATGRQAAELPGHSKYVTALAFSPDGREMITGSEDKTVCIWDVASRRKLHEFKEPENVYSEVENVAFSPDGREAIAQYYGKTVVWDAQSGTKLRELKDAGGRIGVLLPGGKLVAVGKEDRVTVYDITSGASAQAMIGHTAEVTAVTVSPDGKLLASGSMDGTTRLWNAETGEELVRLISIDGGAEWVTITPDGLFDGSPGGRQLVAFRVPGRSRPVPVDRFFNDFYRAGLMASVAGGDRLKAEVSIAKNVPPLLKINSPPGGVATTGSVTIEVEAIDQGGGVAELGIFQNGARLLAPGTTRREGLTVHRTFQVGLVEGRNHFRITAASSDGSWEAEPVELVLNFEEPPTKNDLYLVAIGINHYADATLNLNFAAKDAHSLADLFRRRGKRLYREVHITEVLDQQATRSNIQSALKETAQKTAQGDTLIVVLAGHGTMVGQRYYFVPHELRRQADRLEEDIRKQGLPADEISDCLTTAKALKRVLVLDTCASGGALGAALKGRSGFALRGAIERLSRSSGVFTVAAASATEEAQESKDLGHGVLTYALLAGLKAAEGGPLADKHAQPNSAERVVDTLEWLNFAAGQVPRLTEKLYGAPQDVQIGIQGQSFPVLPLED